MNSLRLKKLVRHIRHHILYWNLLFAALMIALFIWAVDALSTSNLDKEESALQEALVRDITTCYALEGNYPPDLSYLEEHYGLVYDKKRFYVDYRPIASNIRPDYMVIRKEEE